MAVEPPLVIEFGGADGGGGVLQAVLLAMVCLGMLVCVSRLVINPAGAFCLDERLKQS